MTFNCQWWYFQNFDALSVFPFKSFSKICCSKNLFDLVGEWKISVPNCKYYFCKDYLSFAKINFCWPVKFEIFNSCEIFWKIEKKTLLTSSKWHFTCHCYFFLKYLKHVKRYFYKKGFDKIFFVKTCLFDFTEQRKNYLPKISYHLYFLNL